MTKKGMKSVVWGALLAAASGLYSGIVAAQSQFNLQTPQTPIAQKIFDLHTLITWICVIIFVGVFGVMFWAVFKHRKASGHKAAQFHENTVVELVWTIVPFFILIAIAFPATRTVCAYCPGNAIRKATRVSPLTSRSYPSVRDTSCTRKPMPVKCATTMSRAN